MLTSRARQPCGSRLYPPTTRRVARQMNSLRTNKSEAGGVLVMVAIWLPVLVLFLIFAIDVGNWFEHKRHLQMQADAAALAAAGDFRIPCTDTPINTTAMVYSGFTAPAYNQQV